MLRGAIVVVVALGSSVIAAPGAGAGSGVTPPTLAGSLHITLGLPAPGGTELVQVAVDTVATAGEISSLNVTGVNAARLPPGIRAIAVVTPVNSSNTSQTFGVTFAVENLGGGTATRPSDTIVAAVDPTGASGTVLIKHYTISELRCKNAAQLGKSVDRDELTSRSGNPSRFLILRLRSQSAQPSPGERTLDQTIYRRCPSTVGVERPDRSNS